MARSTGSSRRSVRTRARSAIPNGWRRRIRDWAREEGEAIGALAGEAFRVIVIEEDAQEDEGPTHDTPPQTEGGDPD